MPDAATRKTFPVWLIWAALAVLAVASWGELKVLDRGTISPTASDLAQVWVGVHTTFQGRDPYAPEATREIQRIYYGHELDAGDTRVPQRFAYPLDTAVVLAPMALLSWPASRILYLCIVPLLMAASVPLWLRLLHIARSARETAILILLTMLSWPMIWGIRLEQLTLLVAAFLAAACWLLRSRQDIAAGIVLSLATIKPQIALPLAAWLVLWSVLQKRWAFSASLMAGCLALLGTSQVLQPGWVSRWIAVLHDYSHYTEMKPVLVLIFGRAIGTVLLAALVAGAVWILWRLRACRTDSPEFGASCALVLALTASLLPPFSGMIYNQVLLVPAVLLVLSSEAREKNFKVVRNFLIVLVSLSVASIPISFLGVSLAGAARGWLVLPFLDLILPVCTTVATVFLLWSSRPEVPTLNRTGSR